MESKIEKLLGILTLGYMRLKSTDLIFGIQAKKLREFFRTKAVYDNFHPDFFKDEMKLSIAKFQKEIID